MIFYGLFVSSALSAVFEPFEQGIVTLTFDDGYACHYETVLPLLEKYGISATFYVTTSLLSQPGYLSAEEVVQLYQSGHEIASHAVTHRRLQGLSVRELKKELLESKLILESLTQSPIENFAPPFGVFNMQIIRFFTKYYQSSRTVVQDLNAKINLNPFMIRAHVVFNSSSFVEVASWIDKAIAEKKWLVLVYHYIGNDKDIVSVNVRDFERHLQMIKNRNIATMTIKEALQKCSLRN